MSAFHEMIARHAQPGVVAAIWLRPRRREPSRRVAAAQVGADGLAGDHGRAGKRALTLLQAEHLPVIGAMLGRGPVDAALLRRNLVVAGLNLNALKGRRLAIGTALIEITGLCAPCSRMEEALGPGGYSAMRGHGGWCAEVIVPGEIAQGDRVAPVAQEAEV